MISAAMMAVILLTASQVGGLQDNDDQDIPDEIGSDLLPKTSEQTDLWTNFNFYSIEVTTSIFSSENNTYITAQTGSSVVLPCSTHSSEEGIVSWIRRKDFHLLTVGLTTYSSDGRFQAIHYQHTLDWSLQIKYLQKRDSGTYECQIASHPPKSIFVHLTAVEAKAQISGPPEKFIMPGSPLFLQCSISQGTIDPSYVFWYLNERMVNYDKQRGFNITNYFNRRLSELYVDQTKNWHSGNYTCVPQSAEPVSVYVNIFNGEHTAAIQAGSICYDVCGILVIVIIFAQLLQTTEIFQ